MKYKFILCNEVDFKESETSLLKLRRPKYLKTFRVNCASTTHLILSWNFKYIQKLAIFKNIPSSHTSLPVQKWVRMRFGADFNKDPMDFSSSQRRIYKVKKCRIQSIQKLKFIKQYREIENLKIDLSFLCESVNLGFIDALKTILKRVKIIGNLSIKNNPQAFSDTVLNHFLSAVSQLKNIQKIRIDLCLESPIENSFLEVPNQQKVYDLQVSQMSFDNLVWLNRANFAQDFSRLRRLGIILPELTDKDNLIVFVKGGLPKLCLEALELHISFRQCEKEYFKVFLEALELPKILINLKLGFIDIIFQDYFSKEPENFGNSNAPNTFEILWNGKFQNLSLLEVFDFTLGLSEQFKQNYVDCLKQMIKNFKQLKVLKMEIFDCFSLFRANQTLGLKRAFNFHAFLSSLTNLKNLTKIDLIVPFLKFDSSDNNMEFSYFDLLPNIEYINLSHNVDPSAQANIEAFIGSLPSKVKQLCLKFCEILKESSGIERRVDFLSRFKGLSQLDLSFQIRYVDKDTFVRFFEQLSFLRDLASLKIAFINLHLDHDTIEKVRFVFQSKAKHMRFVRIRIHKTLIALEDRNLIIKDLFLL